MQPDQLDWLERLDGLVGAINNTPTQPTGQSPFQLEHGLAMCVPMDTQILGDQVWQNRGEGGLVRDQMVYDQDGKLLDAAPYPAVYEVAEQESYAMDNGASAPALG